MSKSKNILKWADSNKKTILIVSAVILSVVLTIWLGKKIFAFVAKKINQAKIKNDSENHTRTDVTGTLQFGSLVTRIIEAVKGVGTNEQEIYNVLGELRTQADWDALKRTWSAAYSGLGKLQQFVIYTSGCRATLSSTLFAELDASELQHCREILIANGITPDF